MDDQKRAARDRWIWSGGLLLAGVTGYLGGFIGGAWAVLFPFAATTLVVASAATAIGAVASGSRSMNSGKRRVLLWSTWSLGLQLALIVIAAGLEGTTVGHQCDEGCRYVNASMLVWLGGIVAITAIIALFGAVMLGLASAARGGQWWWLVALVAALVVAVSAVVWVTLALLMPQLEGYSPIEAVQGWLLPLTPLLFSILMGMFSRSSARQREPSLSARNAS